VDAHPGCKVKDKLENKLHDLVCDGKGGGPGGCFWRETSRSIVLTAAQSTIRPIG
jgi:hypothetical protein